MFIFCNAHFGWKDQIFLIIFLSTTNQIICKFSILPPASNSESISSTIVDIIYKASPKSKHIHPVCWMVTGASIDADLLWEKNVAEWLLILVDKFKRTGVLPRSIYHNMLPYSFWILETIASGTRFLPSPPTATSTSRISKKTLLNHLWLI
jgi:hypothetical protein